VEEVDSVLQDSKEYKNPTYGVGDAIRLGHWETRSRTRNCKGNMSRMTPLRLLRVPDVSDNTLD
jgi:hypothetical protein